MATKIKNRYGLRLLAAISSVLVLILAFSGVKIEAAGLVGTSLRFTRMMASTGTSFRLVFTVPAGNTDTEASVRINFPDSYTVATTGLTSDTVLCATETGATALPGTLTVAGDNTVSSKNITVSGITDLSASTTYCVDIDRTGTNDPITNPSAGGTAIVVETLDAGDARIDHTTLGINVITNDQVVVNAVVAPTFTFVLDANTTNFTANLDSSVVTYTTPRTITITTNAAYGWITWARDSNVGLFSAAAGHSIDSTTPGTAATLTPGTEGYVLGVQATDAASGGTVTVVPAYAGTGADADGSGLDTSYRQIASSDGTANGDILTLRGKATIQPLTEAALDYTDTWTIIGAGSF